MRKRTSTQNSTVQALSALLSLVLSSYGPRGKFQCIRPSSLDPSTLIITSTSTRIFQSLFIEFPIAKVLVELLQSHQKRCGDGGLFVLALSSKLVISGIESGLPICTVINANEIALNWCIEYLSCSKGRNSSNQNESCEKFLPCRFDLGDTRVLLSLLKTVLGTKGVCGMSKTELHYLCIILLQGFLASLPTTPPFTTFVRFVSVVGEPILSSAFFDGIVIDHTVSETELLSVHRGGLVALFDISLQPSVLFETKDDIETISLKTEKYLGQTESMNMYQEELNYLTKLADELSRLGVVVVASQKIIHPFLKHKLVEKKIIPIERLSIFHMSAMTSVCGGTPISNFRVSQNYHIDPKMFGKVGEIKQQTIGGGRKKYLFISPPFVRPSRPVVTVILCSQNQYALEELEYVSKSAITLLSYTLHSPYIVPGAGCIEFLLSQHIRSQLKKSKNEFSAHTRLCISNFAQILDSIGGSIDNSTPLDEIKESIISGTDFNEGTLFGWDTLAKCRKCVLEINSQSREIEKCKVVEFACVKEESLHVAVETANAIMRVDDVITVNPS
eukprot:TRINITY_DN13415_c0_g1_i1.p1 TRINITY_DN13415_c0_g1~~TRINITY_DN13415_c0_g1_i1.p1  ORF type:complete len:559 (-),score=85.69 TRINITY_DN13415_c0_g1_i1:228-1904(-)